jgi:WD40 repeat protein
MLTAGGDEALPVAWTEPGDRVVLAPKPRAGRFTVFRWAPDGGRAVTLEDGVARVWQLPEPLPSVGGEVAWSPDGGRFVAPEPNGESVAVTDLGGGMVRYFGHQGGPVGGVAWSREGHRLATASADHTVKVWDRDSGRLLRSFLCPGRDPVGRVLWSAGDRRLLGLTMGRPQARLFAWDPDGDPDPVFTLGGPAMAYDHAVDWSSPFANARLSADGTTLVTAGWERLALASADWPAVGQPHTRAWDANDGGVLLELLARPGERVSVSADGGRLARLTAAPGGRWHVSTWDVGGKKELATLKLGDWTNGAMEFSPDGKRLALRILFPSARVEFFDVATGEVAAAGKTQLVLADAMHLIRWSPDGKRLLVAATATPAGATAAGTSSFFSVDGASGEALAEMRPLAGERLMVPPQWSPGGDLLVAPVWNDRRKADGSGAEPPVRLVVWDAATGERLGALGGGLNDAAWDLAWSPDGKALAVAGHDRAVRVWDVGGLKPAADRAALAAHDVVRSLYGHAGDGGAEPPAAAGTFSGVVYRSPGVAGLVRAVAWRQDGRLVASGTWATRTVLGKPRPVGRVHLWDPAAGRTRAVLDAPALALDWTADGSRLVALGPVDDHVYRITVWDVREGEELQLVQRGRFDVPGPEPGEKGPRPVVRFSPDGQRLALVTPAAAGAWDLAGGRLLTLPAPAVRAVEWCPDGVRLLALSDEPGPAAVEVRDAATGAVLRSIPARLGRFRAAVWTPDGRRVITATSERRVAVWDPDSGTELITLPGDASALAWTRDGRTLLGSGAGLQRWEGGGYDLKP